MTIPLTRKDQDFINSVISSARMSNRLYPAPTNSPGFKIAAVRLYLALSERNGSRVTSERVQGRILLCKLIENDRAAAQDYIVQSSSAPFMLDPRINQLVSTYGKFYQNEGAGRWVRVEREHIINSIYNLYHMNMSCMIISRADFRSMLADYDEQKGRIPKITGVATVSVRQQVVEDVLQNPTTSADRKRASLEAAGKCFVCNSPKPRQVPCTVCGYTPKGRTT